MINLGLVRIKELLAKLHNPIANLKVFHIAGTNGKGSVCTYLESILSPRLKIGKYTSPHLMTPNDSIQIGQRPLPHSEYDSLTESTRQIAKHYEINASEFEIQTAVAFRAFQRHDINRAIIEVGLGGIEDATNILEPTNVLCSVITKVAIDHEAFLGTDLVSVAQHKAGIIKPGVPCVVDGSNAPEAIEVFRNQAYKVGAPLHVTTASSSSSSGNFIDENKAVAIAALKQVYPEIPDSDVDAGIRSAHWPGRLEWVTDGLLVDGAHNISAAHELRKYVDSLNAQNVRWVVAFSKPADSILNILVKPKDTVLVTEFPPVEGMPWVKPQPKDTLKEVALRFTKKVSSIPSIEHLSDDFSGVTIICGSLYLVGEYMRHLSEFKQKP